MDLRSTLNLPNPDATIPMKANLPVLEPQLLKAWAEADIYGQIMEARADAPVFVLHDGPPYTNSPIHMGTAMNKILKDFVVKSRTALGYRAPYVPGFDNHGLPIEQAVAKEFHERKETPDIVTLRQACRAHAAKYIDVQADQFQRLGVFGFWKHPYATMEYRFEAEIVRVFKRLVEGGYVYKGLRPTLWSPTSRTALADTEIVYHDHVSTSIYVRFALDTDPNRLFEAFPNFFTIIWTTTPWTIPANLAVAFHPDLTYVVVRVGDDHYLLAEARLSAVGEKLGWEEAVILERLDGINLEGATFHHPLFRRPSIAVMAEYVTTEDGTGVVHTAPSHGRDDFYTGQRYGLAVPNTVDERGNLTAETGEFAGIYYKDCDTVVVDRLAEVGALLKSEPYSHSYPYAERDDRPVIFRATEQWFVGIDLHGLRTRMLEAIQPISLDDFLETEDPIGVNWIPVNGYNRIEAMVKNRPDWCISRQRPWGVGIPIFFGKESGEPVLDPEAIEAVAQLIEREGSDAWFVRSAGEILPIGYRHPSTGETEFTKETDVLDVWFDSGATSLCVLEGNVDPAWQEHWPADLYLEGSDQHRGWFNTSLVLGMAIHGKAPYRQVVTHGFINDETGVKMSKRLGNAIDPVKASDTYGADVLRYWVASVEYTNDVAISDAMLKQFGENYRNVRNTLRFLLGNLSGMDLGAPVTEDLDRWILEQTDLLADDCAQAYRRYEFGEVINGVHNFCREQLSKFYLDSIKDRMYCDAEASPQRRSGQVACHAVLVKLLTILSPILAFTTEETWLKLHEVLGATRPASIHTIAIATPDAERLMEIEGSEFQQRFAALISVRDEVLAGFERWKGTDDVKDSQDGIAELVLPAETLAVLNSFSPDDLAILFKVSEVNLSAGEFAVAFRKSPYLKCERSRLRRADVIEVDGVPLSARDRQVLGI